MIEYKDINQELFHHGQELKALINDLDSALMVFQNAGVLKSELRPLENYVRRIEHSINEILSKEFNGQIHNSGELKKLSS